MPRLNNQIIEVARKNATIYPNDAEFIETLKETLDFLESLPTQFNFAFHKQLKPEKMGSEQPEVFLNLLKNFYGWLGFFVYSHAYKVRHLVSDIVDGLNAHNYVRVTIGSRSVMEHSATLNYYYTKLVPNLRSLDSMDPIKNFPNYIVTIVETIKLLLQYAQSTRFNWTSYIRGDLDNFFTSWDKVEERVRQLNILTLIDKLPQEEKGARFFYEMLCDYVHPNIASHTLIIDEVTQHGDERFSYLLRYAPNSDELLTVVLHAISIPIKSSLSLFLNQLQSLLQTLESLRGWIAKCEAMV